MVKQPRPVRNVFDELPAMPLLLVKQAALRNNLAQMRAFTEAHGVELSPHCKTHMSPELWRMQELSGAAACTVATVAQAQAFAAEGVRQFMIANQVVDRGDLEVLVALRRRYPDLAVSVFVDSLRGVELMEAAHHEIAVDLPPLPVLVEYGLGGWRSGCRTRDQVLEVARAVTAAQTVHLAGLAGYEGVLWPLSASVRPLAVNSYLDDAVDIVRKLDAEGLLGARAIVTFGGSDLYPAVVERVRNALPPDTIRVVLRSGCYLVHDHGKYEQAQTQVPAGIAKPRFEPALEVWASVLSIPESGVVVAGLGRRDVSYDAGLPVPIARRAVGQITPLNGATVRALYDQHAILAVSDDRVEVGDALAFGISHPCTTFDKWRTATLVDADYSAVDTIRTLFP
ncbi:alanine racemase [Streptomyces sp. NPDC004752]